LIAAENETEFECPLSQVVLAGALGLSAIHVMLTVRKGVVKIHDLTRLRKLAGFQAGYLNSRS
jgi:hypothetical protein